MNRFIYVFEERAATDLEKRGYTLLREDTKNQMWIFENKDYGDESMDLSFAANYQMVLSNVLPL